jgi:alpha-glucosidase (family GH31 glycosyl hydrolase)
VHIYNGYLEANSTYEFLVKKRQEKPFILARSHSLGSNQWANHWSGDNVATYEFLRSSIADIFNSQLFGNLITGADICGFSGDTTP